MAKKISPYDKFQALKRNPSYKADYLKFKKWCRERGINPKDYHNHPEAAEKAERLCKKYGIWYLFSPGTKLPRHLGGDYFINEDEVVNVIYPNKYRGLSSEEIRNGKRYKYLPIPVFDQGEFLILKINLTKNKEHIVKETIEKINYYHYFSKENNKRLSVDKLVNKWYVFDIYNETKNFQKTLEILLSKARSEVGFLKSLGIEARVPDINVSTVRKAYYRAFELVFGEAYNPEKHSPKHLPPDLTKRCSDCAERETCTVLCLDVIEYINQDEKYLREKLPDRDIEIEYIKQIRKKFGRLTNQSITFDKMYGRKHMEKCFAEIYEDNDNNDFEEYFPGDYEKFFKEDDEEDY